MTKREALWLAMVDIMAEPNFEMDVVRKKLLNSVTPLSSMGVEARKKTDEIKKKELNEAYSILFGENDEN